MFFTCITVSFNTLISFWTPLSITLVFVISESHSSLQLFYLSFLAARNLKMPIHFVLREVPKLTIAQFTPGILKPFSVVLSVHCYCHVTAIKSDQNIECEIPVFPNQGLFRVTMLSANLFTTLGYLKMHVKNLSTFRSSHQRCYMKKGVLRNFAKFTVQQKRCRPKTYGLQLY